MIPAEYRDRGVQVELELSKDFTLTTRAKVGAAEPCEWPCAWFRWRPQMAANSNINRQLSARSLVVAYTYAIPACGFKILLSNAKAIVLFVRS